MADADGVLEAFYHPPAELLALGHEALATLAQILQQTVTDRTRTTSQEEQERG